MVITHYLLGWPGQHIPNEPATSMLSPETLLILTVPCQSAAQKAEFSEANTILLFLTQYLNTLMYVLQVNSEVNMYLHLV